MTAKPKGSGMTTDKLMVYVFAFILIGVGVKYVWGTYQSVEKNTEKNIAEQFEEIERKGEFYKAPEEIDVSKE